jgi:dUTP pyrophosphatase
MFRPDPFGINQPLINPPLINTPSINPTPINTPLIPITSNLHEFKWGSNLNRTPLLTNLDTEYRIRRIELENDLMVEDQCKSVIGTKNFNDLNQLIESYNEEELMEISKKLFDKKYKDKNNKIERDFNTLNKLIESCNESEFMKIAKDLYKKKYKNNTLNSKFKAGDKQDNISPNQSSDLNVNSTNFKLMTASLNLQNNTLNYTKVDINATDLKKNDEDAGYDLTTIEEGIINPKESKCLRTGIKIQLPNKSSDMFNYYGRIASRSGLALKNNIEVGAGVIDNGYRGEIKVILRNHGEEPFNYKIGDRIAQLIITPYATLNPNLLETIIDDSIRSEKGFGSSGVN